MIQGVLLNFGSENTSVMAEGEDLAELMTLAQYDYQQLADYLRREGMRMEVAKSFEDNLIDGEAFVSMTEEDLKELVPVISDRIKMRKLIKMLSDLLEVCITSYLTY